MTDRCRRLVQAKAMGMVSVHACECFVGVHAAFGAARSTTSEQYKRQILGHVNGIVFRDVQLCQLVGDD